MSLRSAKSLDRLYREVADADLVLVPDAPLASALNRRLDEPHFGEFATTPRRLAAGRRERAEDRQLFLAVIRETDLDWKTVANEIGNVLQCWEHQGALDAILDYPAHVTDATRTVVDCIHDLDIETTSSRLTGYQIPAGTDVAVVGIEQLTTLERSILPPGFDPTDAIDPFEDDPATLAPFRILDSPAAIVDVLLDTITPENADETGVVLDAGSEYSPLVEAALENADIPYYGGPGFTDDPHHRGFLQLLRGAHAGRDTRAGDLRPVLSHLGFDLPVEHDDKRLHDLDHPAAIWLQEFRDDLTEYSFADAIAAYEDATDTHLEAFRDELDTLGIHHDAVTESAVDQLEFYLQAYEVPVHRDNEGVLLADAKSAAHVDRPLVIHLGLDDSWTHSSPRRPWVDTDAEFTRNIQQFQLLLQSGVDQYYLVQDEAGGSPVTPCLYFEELLDEPVERFSDLDSIPHARTTLKGGDGFTRRPLDVTPETVETVSQSGLNTYVNCPRDYFFSRIVDGPDRDYFREGTMFHDFAEFYATHPDAVDTGDPTSDDPGDLDRLADRILDEVDPFLRGVDREVRHTKYRVGLQVITEYLDEHPPEGVGLLTPASGWGGNHFADHFGRPVDDPHTERWFENEALGVKGMIDLVHTPTDLLDFKSGSKKSATQVVKHSALDPPSDTPNYQALLYLAHHRTNHPDETLTFTFFHFLETLDDVVTGEHDIEDCLTTITYHPTTYEDHIASEAVFEELQTDAANACTKTFEQVDYDLYRDHLATHDLPDTRDSDELIDSEFGQALASRLVETVGDYKYVQKGTRQALRHLIGIRNRNFFSDDLDVFEDFVQDRLDELNSRRQGDERFPVEGLGGEPNYRRVDHRDLVLEEGAR